MMQAILIERPRRSSTHVDRRLSHNRTFHALVISGSHVAVLASGSALFLRLLRCPAGAAILLTIAVAWLYAA